MWDDIALEIAIIERLARDAVRKKIASRQLGEAWAGLPVLVSSTEPGEIGTSALNFSRG